MSASSPSKPTEPSGPGDATASTHAYGRVVVSGSAGRRIVRGHPWIWDRAVERVYGDPSVGDVVEVVYPVGKKNRLAALGFAFFDPKSALRGRIVGGGSEPTDGWAADLASRALTLRQTSRTLADTDAMRLVHGEADAMSGLVIDRYGPVAAVKLDGAAPAAFWRPRLAEVCAALAPSGIRSAVIRNRGTVWGDDPPSELIISEGKARFEVDLEHGQKTGLFLDQRPHRRAVGAMSKHKRVLNLFCYTGGFSVHAALCGANSVTSVDQARPAIAAAARNFTHSGLDPDAHEFVAGDCFEFLTERKNRGRFDLVVCDPPSFAPRHSAIPKALNAYANLNRLAAAAVKRRGILVTASCSSHVTPNQFREAVADGLTRARRVGTVIKTGVADADHPTRPGFPEGGYLKVLYIQLD